MEYIIKNLIAAIFGKLTSKTKSTFDKAGYSPYFMYGLALAELVLAIGLFTSYSFYAIIGIIAIMLGAIFTLFQQKAKLNQYISSESIHFINGNHRFIANTVWVTTFTNNSI